MNMTTIPPVTETSDNQLLELCLDGDRDAYGQLVERYQALICSMAYSACGNLAQSQDLAQETFITAWKKLRDLRERDKFKSWLCGIARNLINNARRRQGRAATEGAIPMADVPENADTLPSPRDQAITDDEAELVWESLKEIPENYREPLVLFYREEQSIERVAEALELSQDAVKQRLSRGRKLLKDRVASLVETTLTASRPGKAFTVAVLAALPNLVPQAAIAGVAATAAKGSPAAKAAAASAGLGAAILGPVIGLAGAWFGARAGINATKSPRERQFMVRAAWLAMGLAVAFVLAILAMTFLGRELAHANATLYACLLIGIICAYVIGLTLMIARVNRRQIEIQKEDGTYIEPVAAIGNQPGELTKGGLYGSFGGGILGGCAWLYVLAFRAGDWPGLTLCAAVSVLTFGLSVRACLRNPKNYFAVLMTAFGAIAVFTLVMLNWRWQPWMGHRIPHEAASHYTRWGVNFLILTIYAGILIGWARNPNLRRRENASARK